MKTLTREFYIAKDSKKVISDKLSEESAVCYISESINGQTNVQFFIGRQSKPDKYLAFKSVESASEAIQAFFDRIVIFNEYKEHAYQMTRRINNQTIEVVEIGFESIPREGLSPMAENVRPVPVSAEVAVTKPKLLARIATENRIQVTGKNSSGNADLWDTEEVYYHSWYA